MRAIIALALCLASVAAAPSNPQRIVGGSLTTISQYPTIASLLYSSNLSTYRQLCGGTIINLRSIVTAAHCTFGDAAIRWRARIGSTFANSGGIVHHLSFIVNHPNYNSRTLDSDIAIMRVTTSMTQTNNVRPVTIATANYNLADNQIVWAAGWGRISPGGAYSEQLRHVQIWTINQNTCAQRYRTIGDTVTANMLCSGWFGVGGRDQCQGDSGGPLYHNGVLVGVCSWGNSCALPTFPGVNTRVSRFNAWIRSNM